jgi:hypothetical protein
MRSTYRRRNPLFKLNPSLFRLSLQMRKVISIVPAGNVVLNWRLFLLFQIYKCAAAAPRSDTEDPLNPKLIPTSRSPGA